MANALHNVTEIGQRPAASIVYVTPEMAERWLGHNKVNRNLRNRRVDQFARDMRSGRWQLTGEAIKFGKSGNLIDGQHRLWAVIESGCTSRVATAGCSDVSRISQRLKRIPTILDKLHREPGMNLGRMEDIGGCRAVLRDLDEVYRVLGRISEAQCRRRPDP
jgi:predicted nucleic acid-binding Zn ribbon protein